MTREEAKREILFAKREVMADSWIDKAYDVAIKALEEPERKTGRWIKEYWNGEYTRKCSACNITQTVTIYRGKVNFNYCPYCGADMRGDEE